MLDKPSVNELRKTDVTDLLAGILDDSRDLVEAHASSLRADLSARLAELGIAIKSWMIAFSVAIVTAMLFGLASAASLHELGLGWFGSLWVITGIAMAAVVGLVYRARASNPKASPTPASQGPHDALH